MRFQPRQASPASWSDLDADAMTAREAPAFASVSVSHDMQAVRPVWEALEAAAPASPYQQWRWLSAWWETEGVAAGITPMIVVARDTGGRAVALLPFGLQQSGPLRVARFLGDRYANYHMGLFRPEPHWSRPAIVALLRAAARQAGGVDLYALANQPHGWRGTPNPLALLGGQASPSASHRTGLNPDPVAFFGLRQSAHARKLLRGKRNRLAELGPVFHRVAHTPEEVEAVLTAHLAQKQARFAQLGLPMSAATASLRAFLAASAQPRDDRPGVLELHALDCDDAIVATFGGLGHAGRFSGLLISHDIRPEVARNSPGELLLAAVIERKCREGFVDFDLGIGEARYKSAYCPVADPLFDSFLALSAMGRAAVGLEAIRLRIKRAIKASPRAWRLAQALRRLVVRLRTS